MIYDALILSAHHNRNAFFCGNSMLDNYLKKQVNQDIKRKLATCFVLTAKSNPGEILGFYTLSNNSIPLESIPESIRKKLPQSYLKIPTTLLGRLAVDAKQHGKGVGNLLLIDALKRSYEISKILGSFAVVVNPIDVEAENFYQKYGFAKLPDSGKMFLTMKTIEGVFGELIK
ncbi:MAG TPA: GNAT family N-acetyltransferase [Flavobacterium sp.]|nr:GNAT family N-acetyltransferase [Flavobacterium sp.]